MGGGDKPLLSLGGRSLMDWQIDSLTPQVEALAISANGDAARFAHTGLPVLPDLQPGQLGPLAGILAGLDWASGLTGIKALLTVAGDCPFLPADLAARLAEPMEAGAMAAIAASGGRQHPVIGLWRLELAEGLRRFLVDEGERKAGFWAKRAGAVEMAWPDQPVDPFFNLNRPEDLDSAGGMMEQWMAQAGRGRLDD